MPEGLPASPRACKKCGAPCDGKRHYCNDCRESFYADVSGRSALLSAIERLAAETKRGALPDSIDERYEDVLDAPRRCGLLAAPDSWKGPPGKPPRSDIVDRLVRDALPEDGLDALGRSILELFENSLKVVITDDVGPCDICAAPDGCYDAADRHGVWGNLCEECFKREGCVLGEGKGQYLVSRASIEPAVIDEAATALRWWQQYARR